MMMKVLTALVALVVWTPLCLAFPAEDLVDDLPDYGKPPTTQYSGYLDGSKGCDLLTNGPICKIHYWFAMAEGEDAMKKPVVLWLNGGPGSSSIFGFLQELGPLLIDAKGGLMENPWSWTKLANVVVIEAPIGVGYSYCSLQKEEGKPCQNTDRYTASTSRAAMVDFFTTKFPELKDNEFFITGESYAGVYIPTLSKEILDHTSLNLKGIAVGDPCTDNKAQADSMDSLWYANKYGLMDAEIFDLLWNKCNVRLPALTSKGGIHHVISQLNGKLKSIDDPQERQEMAEQFYHDVVLSGAHRRASTAKDSDECTIALRKFLMSSSRGLSQSWRDLFIDDYSLFAPVSSLPDEHMAAYMSRSDVRKALHVEEAPTTTWPYASVGFDYLSEYDACNENPIVDLSMIDFYQEIVPQLDRTWVYNGDTDPCVSYEGTRLAVKQIQQDELDGGSYRPWFYNQTAAPLEILKIKSPLFGRNLVAQNMGSQLGGYVVNYEGGLAFVTFHGSGHMVPGDVPPAALHFLSKFLDCGCEKNLLSPLMPTNSTLGKLTDEDFKKELNEWTEAAMACPYVTQDIATSASELEKGKHKAQQLVLDLHLH